MSNNNWIDDLDLAILTQLQENGRKSFTDIAKSLGIAVGTVRNRVTRLLEDGTLYIIGRVDPHRVGFNIPASINVSVDPAYLNEAIMEISKFREISYLAIITGKYDLVVDVACRDSNHLTEFLMNRLAKVKGIREIDSSIILRIAQVAQPDLNLVRVDRHSDEENRNDIAFVESDKVPSSKGR